MKTSIPIDTRYRTSCNSQSQSTCCVMVVSIPYDKVPVVRILFSEKEEREERPARQNTITRN